MSLTKILLSASVAMMGLTASAQSLKNTEVQGRAVRSNLTIGLNNVKNLPDAQLQKIGERVSANGFPTKAAAKQMLMKSAPKPAARKVKSSPANAPKYTANDTIFWEGFEEWDGKTMPFIPTNLNKWTTKSNISDLTPYLADGLCPTWTVYQGDGYYLPYAREKKSMLVCMYGSEVYGSDGTTIVTPAPQQDEWLVSPTINAISKSHYLSFDICYSPWSTHYFIENGEEVFDRDRIAYDVEVMITTNTRSTSYNADDYTRVYKLSELVDKEIAGTDMSNDEEVAELLYMKWHHIQIPLSEYDGKNLRVALRYTGTKGGFVLIDAVRISDLLPIAMYDIPQGSLYWGFSDNMYSMTTDALPYKFALVPANVPNVWGNLSNEDSKDFVWTYTVDGKNSAQAKTADLEMPAAAPSALLEMPKLMASSGLRADETSQGYFKIGGNTQVTYDNGAVVNYNLGNYDLSKQWWTAEVGGPGSNQYAFGTGSEAFWASNSNYRYNKVDGIANFYDAPQSPYVFTEVTLPLGDYLNFGAPLACTIYKVENNYVTDEVIAQCIYDPSKGEVNANGSCTPVPGTAGMYLLKFIFPEPLVINDAIFISIDGFSNSNMMAIAPIAQAYNHDNNLGYAFVKLNTQNNGFDFVEVAGALASIDGGSNMNVSMCIGMNAVFPFLYSVDGDVFAVADQGGTESFVINSYWDPAKDWTISVSDSWVKAESVIDNVAQTVSVKITADAMPNGVKGRSATVKISALGCEETITVLQGDEKTAIEGIAASGNSDAFDGIYTLSGQRINSANAKNGIFLVKKNGKFVKVKK